MKKRNICTKKEWDAQILVQKKTPSGNKDIEKLHSGLLSSLKKDMAEEIIKIKAMLIADILKEVTETIEKQAKRLLKKKIESCDEGDIGLKRTIKKMVRK